MAADDVHWAQRRANQLVSARETKNRFESILLQAIGPRLRHRGSWTGANETLEALERKFVCDAARRAFTLYLSDWADPAGERSARELWPNRYLRDGDEGWGKIASKLVRDAAAIHEYCDVLSSQNDYDSPDAKP